MELAFSLTGGYHDSLNRRVLRTDWNVRDRHHHFKYLCWLSNVSAFGTN